MRWREPKIWLGGLALALAFVVLVRDRTIQEGTGIIVATLAASAGWLFKESILEQRTRRAIC